MAQFFRGLLWLVVCIPLLSAEETPDLDRTAQLIVKRTNEFRRDRKRDELKISPKLEATARDFAAFMARTDKYGHDADGRQPDERVKEHEYEFCTVAENIAYEFRSEGFQTTELAKKFVEGWKNSPGHRENMLDPELLEIGAAVAHSDGSGRYYAVQVFGRPKSVEITFEVVNRAGAEVAYQIGEEKLTLEPRYTRTHHLCVPAELRFDWSEEDGEARTFQPAQGDRFIVTRSGGKLKVEKRAARPDENDE